MLLCYNKVEIMLPNFVTKSMPCERERERERVKHAAEGYARKASLLFVFGAGFLSIILFPSMVQAIVACPSTCAGQASVSVRLDADAANTLRHRARAEFTSGIVSPTVAPSNTTFELKAGDPITVKSSVSIGGTGTPIVGTITLTVKFFDDAGTEIRSVQTLSRALAAGDLNGTFAGTDITFRATSNGDAGGTPKAGTYKIRIDMVYTGDAVNGTYTSNSDGTYTRNSGSVWQAGTPLDVAVTTKGYLRAGVDLTAISVSQTLGGVTPSTFAWPDSARVRIVSSAQALNGDSTKEVKLKTNGSPIRNQATANAKIATTNWDDNGVTGFQLDTTDPASFGIVITLNDNTGTGATGGYSALSERPWTHFENGPGGIWTLGATDGGGTKSVSISTANTAFAYNSAVTLNALNNQDDGGANTRVYNRGEVATVKVDVKNARGEAFTARGTETIKSARTADSATEETCSLSTSGATKTCALTFGSSGNTAPATTAGDAKGLIWTDVGVSNPPTPAITAQYGALSSLYFVTPWTQLNTAARGSTETTSGIIAADTFNFFSRVQNVRQDTNIQTSGSAVTFTLKRPDGTTRSTVTADTGSNGWTPDDTFNFGLEAPAGVWTINPSVTFNGNSGSSSENITAISPYTGNYQMEAVGWNQTYSIGDTARFTIRTLQRNTSGTFVATAADSVPTYDIRYWDGATWQSLVAASSTIALSATGTYEDSYAIPNDSSWIGRKISISFSAVMNGTRINETREIEIVGSPAQVVINSVTDTMIPTVSASVRITNEGTAAFEYTYEWCVVSVDTNQCGGGDDVAYGSAAKLIQAGANFDTTLTLNVTNTGNYIFKVAVWWSNQSSKASRTFTATSDSGSGSSSGSSSGGGGGGSTPTPQPIEQQNTFAAVWQKIAEILSRILGIENRVNTLEVRVASLERQLGQRTAAPASRQEIYVPQSTRPSAPKVEAPPKERFRIRLQ